MKQFIAIISVLCVFGFTKVNAQCGGCAAAKQGGCNTTTKTQCSSNETADVQVYYFHATRRCATCQAVEKVARQTVADKFAGSVSFVSINREQDKNKTVVKKYKVSGQTLLLVKGDKVINLTNDAFMNARTKPEKFQKILKDKLNKLIG